MRILLAEDSLTVATVTRSMLEKHGYQVFHVQDGYAAITEFQSVNPDLVLMDLDMPGMDGVEATVRIRALQTDASAWVPIIFQTATDNDDSLVTAINAGADDYLVKPVSEKVLLAKIKAQNRLLKMRRQLKLAHDEIESIAVKHKKAEDLHRQISKRWKFAIEGSGDGVWEHDLSSGRIMVSPRLTEILGIQAKNSESAARLDHWLDLLHPDYQDASKNALQQIREGKTDRYAVEQRIKHADGHYIWLMSRGMVVDYADNGQPLRLVGTASDITKTKEADVIQVHSVLQASPEGMLLVDQRGLITFANTVAGHMFGYPISSLIGKNVDFLVPHNSRASHPQSRNHFHAHPTARPMAANKKLRALHQNGTEFPVEISLSPIDLNGEKLIITSVTDITERVKAEEQIKIANDALTIERSFLKALINTIPDLIWLKDPDGVYLACNPAFERFFGRSEAEIVGRTDYDFVPQDLGDFFRAKDKAAMEAGKPTVNEEWITFAADGHQALIITTKTPMRQIDGKLMGVLGIAHDITELRGNQAELEQHRKNLESLVEERTQELKIANQKLLETQFAMDSVGIGIHWVDFDSGQLIHVNEQAASLLGYSVEEMLTKTVMDIDPNFTFEAYATLREKIRAEGHIQTETTERTKDGALIPVDLSVQYQEGNESYPPRLIAFLTNITKRKQAEQEAADALEKAEFATRSRGEFLANMSHEIRTPINAVLGLTYLALKANPEIEQKSFLQKIQQSGEHLLGLVNDILDFSKIDAGKLDLEEGSFHLERAIQDVIHLTEGKAREKNLALITTIHPDVPVKLTGDPLRLGQILINYINNAIKFTEQGRVELRITRTNTSEPASSDNVFLRFEVQDTGIGLTEEQQNRLFQSFEQADKSTTRKFGGSGLGLVICKKLAKLMNGDVGVSSHPGKGSTFWFTAKLREDRTPGISYSGPEGFATSGKELANTRILVVDDNLLNLEVAKGILESIGVQVLTAANGQEALECLKQSPVDAVLMDMHMPVMDGLEATRRIRSDPQLAHMPILGLTANVRSEDHHACMSAGMNDIVTKPFNPPKLFANLLKWLCKNSAALTAEQLRKMSLSALSSSRSEVALTQEPPLSAVDVDFTLLRNLANNNPERIGKLIRLFTESADKMMHELEIGMNTSDADIVRLSAHRVKSSARYIGAHGFADYCEAVENLGIHRTLSPLPELLSAMHELLKRIKQHIAAELKI